MDFALTDEQQLIRATAREFTDNEIVDRARENDRNHHFDVDLVRKIADQGYLGAIVPRASTAGRAWTTSPTASSWRRSAGAAPRCAR
ncbi:MAG: acyl-CoA dehydrogenase family protein [Solirubrobacteraceae bacterium]